MDQKTRRVRVEAPSRRWGQERRLEFIDFRLRWDRTLNRSQLVEQFRISPQQASADLSTYMRLAPKNLEYDRSLKTYRATVDFKPAVARDDAQVFLDQLAAMSTGTLAPSTSSLGWCPPFDVVRVPTRQIATRTLLQVLWAIRDQEELKVLYQSMRRPAPTSRWMAPHALAHDGRRWHVRAWCHENGDFRDFVISRIQRVQQSRQTSVQSGSDVWWHTFVDVVVRPREGLTEAQQAAVELDFGMTQGRLKINCRKALAFYVLRELRLDRPTSEPPAAQPLELLNSEDLADVIRAARKSSENTRRIEPKNLEKLP